MGVYGKTSRNRKFFKRRPKKGGRRLRNRVAKMSDVYRLSRQVSNTRELKQAFSLQQFDIGSYNAANEGLGGTYSTKSLAIDGGGSGGIAIPLGTKQNERIGNNIRIKKVMLKMNFTVNAVAASGNPIPKPQLVKVMFGYSKSELGRSRQSLPPDALKLYKLGGAGTDPLGTVQDLVFNEINTDLYTIVKKSRTMRIGNSAYFQSQINQQDFNNNTFEMFKSYSADLTKFYHKNQHFYSADTGSSNRGLYMYIATVDATGDTSTSFPLNVNYELCVSYTDS